MTKKDIERQIEVSQIPLLDRLNNSLDLFVTTILFIDKQNITFQNTKKKKKKGIQENDITVSKYKRKIKRWK